MMAAHSLSCFLYRQDRVVAANQAKIIEGYLKASNHIQNGTCPSASQDRIVERYFVPGAGHQVMVVNPELVNPVITEFLIKKCGLGDVKWSLANFEQDRWAKINGI